MLLYSHEWFCLIILFFYRHAFDVFDSPKSTVMPDSYHGILVGLMVANLFWFVSMSISLSTKAGIILKKTVAGKDIDTNVVGKEIDPEA